MAKRNLDDTDRRLISLLRASARMPTAAVGRHLGLSRSAVQERLKRLELRDMKQTREGSA